MLRLQIESISVCYSFSLIISNCTTELSKKSKILSPNVKKSKIELSPF
jgi:hypothetical protein